MTRRLLLIAALAACTVDRDVLFDSIATCTAALPDSAIGMPCAFAGTCEQTGASACDTITASCTGGVVMHALPADCTPCTDDSACTYGSALCGSAQICEACPSLDVCATAACPADTQHLTRNGCAVCECAPPPTCTASATTAACAGVGSACYRGAACATGCVDDDPGCCSSQCAATGCSTISAGSGLPAGRIPTGCAMACGSLPATCASNSCIATKCTCDGSGWTCEPACAAGATPSCTFTP